MKKIFVGSVLVSKGLYKRENFNLNVINLGVKLGFGLKFFFFVFVFIKYWYFFKCLFYFFLVNEICINWFLFKYGIVVYLNGFKVLLLLMDLLWVINWVLWEGFLIVFFVKMNMWIVIGDLD